MSHSFNFPEAGTMTFGRRVSVADAGGVTLAVTQLNRGPWSGLLLRRESPSGAESVILETPGMPQEPVLVANGGRAVCVWNDVSGGVWSIRAADVEEDAEVSGKPVTLWQSGSLCLPPAAGMGPDGTVWVAWSARENGRIGLRLAVRRDNVWALVASPPCAGDAFRPSVACVDGRVLVAWDEYVDQTYRIGVAEYGSAGWARLATLGEPGERWMGPRLAGAAGRGAYLCGVVMKEVEDSSKGIADHFPFAVAARITGPDVQVLTDTENAEDPRIAADLREGLLASQTYMGYHGLRRNPYIAVQPDGVPCLFWEVRVEAEKNHVAGHLACRALGPDGFGPCRFVHDGGYGYAVASAGKSDGQAIAYFLHGAAGMDILQTACINPGGGKDYAIEPADWGRWTVVERTPPAKPSRTATVRGRSFRMFWADTHCHGVFSPDAEGETDELIHFGRDLAGLDAICVIDNDFYPHKTLSEAEWQVHQEFCRHLTVPGEFVAFPGWEFTYHRDDLKPSYNHRCVIYPNPGGVLFRRTDPESASDYALFDQLKGRGAMCYPHHCTYRIIDPAMDWNVEVTSSWRVCIEETSFTLEQLCQGARFGFVGSSDSHRSVPGLGGALTGLYATDLTPEGLFDAYRCRRTLATQGFFMFADFRVGGFFIGGAGECEGDALIEIDIETPEPIEFVEILRDGQALFRFEGGGCAFREQVADTTAAPGVHFYILRVKLVGDPGFNSPPGTVLGAHTSDSPYPHNLCKARGVFGWSSPIWVDVKR